MRALLFRLARPLCILICLSVLLVRTSSGAEVVTGQLWFDFDDTETTPPGQRLILPSKFRALQLDLVAMKQRLDEAPREGSAASHSDPAILGLPLPTGGFGKFQIVESPVMESGLASKFPQIRTYRGQGIDDPDATVRLDSSPHGFHAAILSPSGRIYIDPYSQGDDRTYISYFTTDLGARDPADFSCGVTDHDHRAQVVSGGSAGLSSGTDLRQYRIAVAATGEYTNFHGGTVGDGLAAIVTSMNRINGVYEREVALRMNLVANNDLIVYTDPATDPYNNSSGIAMLGQNQANLDSVIGSVNYDIGHVFSTAGGGVASLGVVCAAGSKARGVTGLSSPTGDVFWIDFVAHEMGHQWGGNHSFNGSSGNCSGGNRNSSTAYEPGSGSTIMAYAGICSRDNIQANSDDYFHGVSFDEIITYSTVGRGDSCAATTPTGNSPPSVAAGYSYTIPIATPFELCGSAVDPNGDPITHSWEQFDLGPAGSPQSPSGNAPIFRSLPATKSPCRTFPKLDDLVDNTQTIGEILPTYSRIMHFRLTARDNRSGGGGVGVDSDTVVTVSDSGGPFLVTTPNTAVIWEAGASESIAWDVAGTSSAPIGCSEVDVTMSDDGGYSYPHIVVRGTPNGGSEIVAVPGSVPSTTEARLRVQCSSSSFFDISDVDFEVDGSTVILADGFESGDVSAWTTSSP